MLLELIKMNDQFPERKRFDVSGTTQSLSMDYSLAACLCYVPLGIVLAIVWLVTEPKANLYVRFHAIQSLFVLGAFTALSIVAQMVGALGGLPIIGFVFTVVSGLMIFAFSLAWLVATVMLALKAKAGEMYKLPYLGDIAENMATQ